MKKSSFRSLQIKQNDHRNIQYGSDQLINSPIDIFVGDKTYTGTITDYSSIKKYTDFMNERHDYEKNQKITITYDDGKIQKLDLPISNGEFHNNDFIIVLIEKIDLNNRRMYPDTIINEILNV